MFLQYLGLDCFLHAPIEGLIFTQMKEPNGWENGLYRNYGLYRNLKGLIFKRNHKFISSRNCFNLLIKNLSKKYFSKFKST